MHSSGSKILELVWSEDPQAVAITGTGGAGGQPGTKVTPHTWG